MGAGFSIVARGKTEADVFIYEDVGASFFGGVTAKQFADELKAVKGVDTLNLRINSPGGDVFDGMAIYRQLVEHPAKVVAHIDGLAASIASVIAMAGDEVRIGESAFVMIHNAYGFLSGGSEDFRRMADTIDKVTAAAADIYAEKTGKPTDEIRAWMDAETWFSGGEALSAGLVDEVVLNLKIAARFDPSKHSFRNPPAALTAKAEAPAPRPNLDAARQAMQRMQARRLLSLRTA